MTSLVLGSADPTRLLSHLALYGLAAIAADQGAETVRVSWTAGMAPRPELTVTGWDPNQIADAVHRHAARHTQTDSWLRRDLPDTRGRGLMSPRLSTFRTDDEWETLQHARHAVLDQLTAAEATLDQQLLHALGEPAYWRFNQKGERLQDDGASRLEMTPRNQGSELVGTRLRKLADAVAARTPGKIRDGLLGITVDDEAAGPNAHTSRSANGLAPVGPVDNAIAWCAQWGISQLPLAFHTGRTATTTGHIGAAGAGHFYAPTWRAPWAPARLHTILASRQLRDVAETSDRRTWTDGDAAAPSADETTMTAVGPLADGAARAWLATRGVLTLYVFPVRRYGSANAPERRAQRGEPIRLDPR